MKLRDQLLDALKTLPGTRHFHLHALVSAPHKHTDLYPYASTRPRIYAQHILILCSEQVVNQITEGGPDSGSEPEPSRVFVTVIEATLFHIPATASAILYIAKVDSTGQGTRPAPTSALVRALVAYYAHPDTRPPKLRGMTLWVHLFARAERQYLFPNSADHPAKKPLNDVKLCVWWKRVMGRVAQELGTEGDKTKMYYVLPGMNELEALQALGEVHNTNSTEGPKWIYGHPYSQTEVHSPYVPANKTASEPHNLGQLIPSFDDDPKSRFMDEIACTTQVDGLRSPQRKRRRTDNEHKDEKSERGKEKEKDTRIHGELGLVSVDEFWERMSFRQECIAGAITGFFVLIFPSAASASDSSSPTEDGLSTNPLAPQPGEVSHHLVQRVVHSLMTCHEFSTTERSLRATSILEASIRGLCSGSHVLDSVTRSQKAISPFLSGDDTEPLDKDKQEEEHEEASTPQFLEPPKTPPRRRTGLPTIEDISPNPFPEPEPSVDSYSSCIYGEVKTSNPDASPPTITGAAQNGVAGAESGRSGKGNTGGVTVLTVRKKKRT